MPSTVSVCKNIQKLIQQTKLTVKFSMSWNNSNNNNNNNNYNNNNNNNSVFFKKIHFKTEGLDFCDKHATYENVLRFQTISIKQKTKQKSFLFCFFVVVVVCAFEYF